MTDLLLSGLALAVAEVLRRTFGPSQAVGLARKAGARARSRNTVARGALARNIGRIDRRIPGGGNCYRRVLAELILDSGAAAEPVRFGLAEGATPKSGHVWFESRPDEVSRRPFAVTFTV